TPTSFSFATSRSTPTPTLFPSTTLFRSPHAHVQHHRHTRRLQKIPASVFHRPERDLVPASVVQPLAPNPAPPVQHLRHRVDVGRSEEHTSELQSRENLVCRLLLEKKKQI